ncbi:hydrolase [Pyrococcus yayanosii CH1]|uniref:Hydrolase n=1 Tax=Pyrococcus yayanosii (strain CH1 / JCM 16557) TaxID=529709 RepID=F8AIT5_PYRYC|nr:hydrolase [Pyrococcus yayanosii CH1]
MIVDLDDTLCNTWEAAKKAAIRLLPRIFRLRKFRAFLYVASRRYKELEEMRELHLLGLDEIVQKVMGRIYKGENYSDIAEEFDKAFFSHLHLYPDAEPFLRGLKEMGAKIVLVTDSSARWQRRKIEHLGIARYLDGVIISGETGHTKFEPHNFILAKRMFPKERRMFVVGDRDETDMKGGKSIGATTILVRRGYFKGRKARHADFVVKNLSEALEVIEREHKA